MTGFYTVVAVYFVWTLIHDRFFPRINSGRALKTYLAFLDPVAKVTRQCPLWASGTLLILLYAVQLFIIDRATVMLTFAPDWYWALPVRYVPHLDAYANPAVTLPSLALALIAVLQSFFLFCIYSRLRSAGMTPQSKETIFFLAAYLFDIAFCSPVMPSADLYSYIAYGHLGAAAYAPPNLHFTGPFAAIDQIARDAWGKLDPAPYGPVFIAYCTLLLRHMPTLLTAILMHRAACVAALGLFIYSLNRLRVPAEICAIFLLNPAMACQFVTDGHNDIFALALTVFACTLTARGKILAGIAAVAAGLIKLPYALFSAVIFSQFESRMERFIWSALCLAATFILSYVLGGPAYLNGLFVHSHRNVDLDAPFAERAQHILLAGGAVVALLAAVWRRVFNRGAILSFPGLAAALYPWYIALSIPYAVVERNSLARLAILLPLITLTMDWNFDETCARDAAIAAVVATLFSVAFRSYRIQLSKQPKAEV